MSLFAVSVGRGQASSNQILSRNDFSVQEAKSASIKVLGTQNLRHPIVVVLWTNTRPLMYETEME